MGIDRKWQDALLRVTLGYGLLPEQKRQALEQLCLLMMERKRSLQALVARVDAASHCAGCGGACCVTGRYHFTAVDLLAYLVASEPLLKPCFENACCPYLGEKGCLMEPQFRPFNCITFNCELIEERLTAQELERFYALERELRANYREIRSIFPDGSMNGALL